MNGPIYYGSKVLIKMHHRKTRSTVSSNAPSCIKTTTMATNKQ